MDVAVSELQDDPQRLIEAVQNGSEVTILDGNKPVAKLVGVEPAAILQRLVEEGTVSYPQDMSPYVIGDEPRPVPTSSLSDLAIELRNEP